MKTIRMGMSLLFKTTLLALFIAVLIPILYFAWRMGKPLPQPEFKGLTYYQYFEWRKLATENAISKYMISHPNFEYSGIGEPMTACYSGHFFGAYLLLTLQSLSYTLAALTGQKPNELHPLPTNVTLLNFVPKWWDTFEYLFWYNQIHLDSFSSLVAMCRIQPNIPTPEELEALKLERQLQGLKPSARTEAQGILPQLQDFPGLWKQLTNGEKRNLLGRMFQVIYFDSQGKIREVVAHAPFKELLGV